MYFICINLYLAKRKQKIVLMFRLLNYFVTIYPSQPAYEDRLVSYRYRSGDGKTDIYICMEYMEYIELYALWSFNLYLLIS